jgi:hypothetical protein
MVTIIIYVVLRWKNDNNINRDYDIIGSVMIW